jgi:tRNA threonylcarbamoyl adenosine modification protein YeaZ
LILAFDTTTSATTVALIRNADVVSEKLELDARRHAELLVPTIKLVLGESRLNLSDLTAIAVGVGPGAFTGLRVGLVTARALGDGLDIPVHGGMTLDALAYASGLDHPFAVVVDARRKEVFWAHYSNAITREAGPFVGRPDDVVEQVAGIPVVGAAATPFAEMFADVRPPELPSAAALGQLTQRLLREGKPLLEPIPLYLRRPDVTPSAGAKSVLT